MIEYTVDHWQVTFIFQLKGSVFLKSLFLAVPSTIAAIVLHMFIIERDTDLSMGQFGSYNFVLGFLIVFRCQQAYSRFWEAASILQQVRGTWFNSISACFAFCSMAPEDAKEVLKFKHALIRLGSLLYCTSLQQVAVCTDDQFEIISLQGFSESSLMHLAKAPEKPLIVMQWIQQLVVKGHNEGVLKVPAPVLSRVFQELSNGIIGITDAQKITDIPFPFPLAQLVATMLLVCAAMTPVALASTMTNPIWCALLTFATVFCFTGINFIAAEIEMPFGDDPNDLPMHTLQSSLNSALIHLLDDESASCPEFTLTEDVLMCPTEACPPYLISKSHYKAFKDDVGKHAAGGDNASELAMRQSKIKRIYAKGLNLVAKDIAPDRTDSEPAPLAYENADGVLLDSAAMEEIEQTLQKIRIESLEVPPAGEDFVLGEYGEGQAALVSTSPETRAGTRSALPSEPRDLDSLIAQEPIGASASQIACRSRDSSSAVAPECLIRDVGSDT